MTTATPTSPDATGHFGPYGGRYVPEVLMPAIEELTRAYEEARSDEAFRAELDGLLADYAGRPSPITFAANLTAKLGGGRILLKREDLNHTGSHKINNVLGQLLLARRMGKKRVIAETGAGQHGVATATAAALFGMDCHVYMGTEDMERQHLNVFRMRLLGTEVVPVDSGTCTLKDAMNEAMRDWATNVASTFYCIGSVAGPHPYPLMVREFQSVIGREARAQMMEKHGRPPTVIMACVGGGSNAMGIFHEFIPDEDVALIGVEAAGEGIPSGRHAATLGAGKVGVLHGSKSYVLFDEDGQVHPTHSVSAGLDYPGVGPEHAYLKDTGRARYVSVTDTQALEAFKELSRTEGIIPALESAHAVAYAIETAGEYAGDDLILVNLSGRGDKDSPAGMEFLGL